MLHVLKKFYSDDSGAVTVDWVVLTAAVIALAITFMVNIDSNTDALAENVATKVGEQTIE